MWKGYAQTVRQLFIDFHDCRLVSASVAIIRCAKDGDDVAILTPIVAYETPLVHDETATIDTYLPLQVDALLQQVSGHCYG
jgi:hypothetical protein